MHEDVWNGVDNQEWSYFYCGQVATKFEITGIKKNLADIQYLEIKALGRASLASSALSGYKTRSMIIRQILEDKL